MNKPTFRQRIAYDLGRELPPELHEWVVHDLVGRGAMERYLVRFIGPVLPLFALLLLIPMPPGLELALVVGGVVPLVIFTVALSYVWRRFRLQQHGLDTELLDHPRVSDRDRELYNLHYRHG